MVRIIITAVWVCAIIAGSVYATVIWKTGQTAASEPDEFFGGLDYVKVPTISVPVIDNGKITGYVVAEFVFTGKAALLKQLSVPVEPFLADEAFRLIYAGRQIDFADLKKYDLDGFRTKVASNLKDRFGSEIVKDVLVEQFNFVPMSQIRFGPKRKRKTPTGE